MSQIISFELIKHINVGKNNILDIDYQSVGTIGQIHGPITVTIIDSDDNEIDPQYLNCYLKCVDISKKIFKFNVIFKPWYIISEKKYYVSVKYN